MALRRTIIAACLLAFASMAMAKPAPSPGRGHGHSQGNTTVDAYFLGDPGPGGPVTKSILYGASVVLWPDFQDGNGVIDHSVGTVTSGQSYTVSPLTDTTYTLTVTNAANDSVSGTVTINVATVTMTGVSPATKTISATRTFTFGGAVVSGAVNPGVNWSVDGVPGGNASVGTITAGGLYTAPATPGSHTVRATSAANPSVYQESAVTVVELPVISVAMAATPASINYGGSSTLSATWQYGTASLTDGTTTSTPSSPLSESTGTLTATKTYTLTVTNAAGDSVNSQVTVTVTPTSMTDLAPATKTLSLTKTFTVTGGVVTGAVDTSVTWSVIEGAGYGTVDSSGVYTAPGSMPGGSTVTIRCTSNANAAVYKEMTVTLVKLPTIQSFTVE